MTGIIIVFGISILCAAGAVAIWEKAEETIRYVIKKRRAKKELAEKRAAVKDLMRAFREKEKDRILVRESTLWVEELEIIFKDRDKALKNAEGVSYFEKF